MLRLLFTIVIIVSVSGDADRNENRSNKAAERKVTSHPRRQDKIAPLSEKKISKVRKGEMSSSRQPREWVAAKEEFVLLQDIRIVGADDDAENVFLQASVLDDREDDNKVLLEREDKSLGYEKYWAIDEKQRYQETATKQAAMNQLSSLEAVRTFFQDNSKNDDFTARTPSLKRNLSNGGSPGSSGSPSPTPFQGDSGGGSNGNGPASSGGGGGGNGSPFSGNLSNGERTGNPGGWPPPDGDGDGGGWNHDGGDDYHNQPGENGPPKFNGCTDDFFIGAGDCNFTSSKPNFASGPNPDNGTNLTHGGAPPIAANEIELGVSVLLASTAQMDLTYQVTAVINDLLNADTTFHALEHPFMQLNMTSLRKNNVWLIQDPMHSNVSLFSLSTLSTTIWQRYTLGYQCFRGHSPIPNEGTTQLIFSICQNVIDESISSGTFLSALQREPNVSAAAVEGVAIFGEEDEFINQRGTFPAKLSTAGWDARRVVGLCVFCSTIIYALLLMHLGARWEEKLKKEELWGIPLGTEEDVGSFLNLGFIWQQGDGHEGPPKGVVVFNKQKLGYRDDDSMLMGGFQNPHEVVDTTLPSSATS